MINGDTLKALLRSARLGYVPFAYTIQREPDVVANWLNDREPAPPYAGLTISAIKHNLKPATDDQMQKADLIHALGLPPEQARYWQETRQYPHAARFALAATIYDKERETPLTSSDLNVLRRFNLGGRHYRVRNGWRAKPVLGKRLPLLQLATPRRLLGLGLLEQITQNGFKPYLQLTPVGKERITK